MRVHRVMHWGWGARAQPRPQSRSDSDGGKRRAERIS